MAEAKIDPSVLELTDRVVSINRVAKVVKGGRRFSFTALVVVGDGRGRVGMGLGKAHEVPEAIRKAVEHAKKDLIFVPLKETTIPCEITGHLEDVRGLRDHAAHGRRVLVGHLLPDAAEPQRPDRRLLLRGEADERAHQRDPKLRACHQPPPPPGSRPRPAAARRAGPAGA